MTINERVSPETLDKIIEAADEVIRALAAEIKQYRAAAEPVYQYQAFTFVENSDGEQEKFWFWSDCDERFYTACKGTKRALYAAPQVTSVEREAVRADHVQWSQATFGNVGPIGPLKHLSKEALEAAAAPDDLSEWADMQFLLWDAQRRAGITDEQITQAMVEKLAVNKKREWPAPKDGEPRLHIAAPAVQAGQEPIYQLRDVDWYDTDKRTYDTVVNTGGAGRIVYAAPQLPQPAVVPDAIEIDDDFDSAFEHGKAVGWNAYRAAMLQGAEPVSQPYTLPEHSPCADAPDHIWLQTAGEWPASGEFSELTWSCDNQHPDDTLYVRADLVGKSPGYLQGYKDGCEWSALMAEANHPQTGDWLFDDPIELAKAIRKGPDMLPVEPDNSPAIPDGWIPVSERLPDDDDFVYIWPRPDFGVELHVGQYCKFHKKGAGWYAQVNEQNYGIEWYRVTVTHWMPLPAAPQQEAE